MGESFLVTGGAGFIGSHLVDDLLRLGHRVRVLDNFSTGSRGNLAGVMADVDLLEGDLRSYERAHNAVKSVDRVIHLGALPSVPRSVQDPLTTNAVNINGTLNILLAARDNDVSRVVLASSSSVYGANTALPKREDLQTLPISPYGVSKLAAETYCAAFHHVYELETVGLRYFNVFGPRQNPYSQYSAVVPKFARAALTGDRPVIYGDGGQTRDFTYVANVVDATVRAATAPGISGQTMNIACGESRALMDLVRVLEDLLGVSIDPIFEPARDGDIRDSFADISKARELLGYEPRVSFEDGIAAVVDSVRETL